MILSLIRFPLACIGQAVDIFWQMHEQNKLLASMWATPDSAADAAGAGSVLTTPLVSADRPSSPNPPGAAGSHHELVELIAEVLFDCRGMSFDGQAREVAERIEKATPPAPFTFGDLGRAAQVINDYVATTVTDLTVTQMASLRNLAERLADAADADPNP